MTNILSVVFTCNRSYGGVQQSNWINDFNLLNSIEKVPNCEKKGHKKGITDIIRSH
jgi:hypothetical protein